MIGILLFSIGVAAAQPPPAETQSLIGYAEQAIAAGRVEQAKRMASRAIAAGSGGPALDTLLADIDFASGNFQQALNRYESLRSAGARSLHICQQGATAALRIGREASARTFANCAIEGAPGEWRAWNTRGVVADLMQEWTMADHCYSKALELAPDEASIINNKGWSLLLRGDWSSALVQFERAATLQPTSTRIANNLDLARAALASDLPVRRPGEASDEWARRLNDAGVAAQLLGEKPRAIAAFTQALEVNPIWYPRAWNNLQSAEKN